MIEEKLAPIFDELEDIRKRLLSLDDKEQGDVKKIDETFKLKQLLTNIVQFNYVKNY